MSMKKGLIKALFSFINYVFTCLHDNVASFFHVVDRFHDLEYPSTSSIVAISLPQLIVKI